MANPNGSLDFIRLQLDIFQTQSSAIESGDLITAATASNQLQRTMPGIVQIVEHSRNGGSFTQSEKELIEDIVREIKHLQTETSQKIEHNKEELASVLNEFRIGKKLLTRYRPKRKAEGRLFDIIG